MDRESPTDSPRVYDSVLRTSKVQVGKDQEKAQSEKDSHSKKTVTSDETGDHQETMDRKYGIPLMKLCLLIPLP